MTAVSFSRLNCCDISVHHFESAGLDRVEQGLADTCLALFPDVHARGATRGLELVVLRVAVAVGTPGQLAVRAEDPGPCDAAVAQARLVHVDILCRPRPLEPGLLVAVPRPPVPEVTADQHLLIGAGQPILERAVVVTDRAQLRLCGCGVPGRGVSRGGG